MLTTNTTRPMTDIKKYAKENRPEISSQRRAALADIHRMRKIAGIDDHDDWQSFLSSWGAISCKDLDYNTLQQIRWRLHQITDPKDAKQWKPIYVNNGAKELDMWRAKVHNIIRSWFRRTNYQGDAAAAEAIACRVAHVEDFYDIPLNSLKRIYFIFANKVKGLENRG